MKNPYEDIINLPHHRSTLRPSMSAHNRAAQFSPFAALTGHESATAEAARLTDKKIELDEYTKANLSDRLFKIQDQIDEHPEVSITYFKSDKKKSGGAYITVTGCVKKIDEHERTIKMQDNTIIKISDILEINGELFFTDEYQD